MVFESIVVEILNRTLGQFVENLDSSQLKLGIWGGDIVLKNLRLKATALDQLDLPVLVKWGELGKLVLKIPWKNLYAAPVVVDIEDLFLLAVPNNQIKYDAEKEEKWLQEAKMAKLLKIEEAKKKEALKNEPKPDDSFVEKLITQIIKNVQVTIARIHIRYEDVISNPKRPFCAGATLYNLTVVSTDSEFRDKSISADNSDISYKILKLEELCAYWNPGGELFSYVENANYNELFRGSIATPNRRPEDYRYILGPIHLTATLKMNTKPELQGFVDEKMLFRIELEEIATAITRCQFQDLLFFVDNTISMLRGYKYRKFRPFVNSYKGHYKEWWRFAYNCVVEDVRRRRLDWDWNHMLEHRNNCKNYVECYIKKLRQKKIAADVDANLQNLERKLDIFSILLMRERAELDAKKSAQIEAELKPTKSWFGNWWSSSKGANNESFVPLSRQFEEAMTAEEKSKLYKAINYEESSAPTDYPRAYVAFQVIFVLKRVVARVYDDSEDNKPLIVIAELDHVAATLKYMPGGGSLSVTYSIQDFLADGPEDAAVRPRIIKSKREELETLINGLIELNPLDGECDVRIHSFARPLRIIYDADSINRIVEVFDIVSDSDGVSELKLGSNLPNLKKITSTGLQYAIEKHTRIDLQVHIDSSIIIIPYKGLYKKEHTLLILNLGTIDMRSEKMQNRTTVNELYDQGLTPEEIFDRMTVQGYDTFRLELQDMQILMRLEKEDWEAVLKNPASISPLQILQPTTLTVFFKNCLVANDARLAKAVIEGQVAKIMITISDVRLLEMIALGNSIPLPGASKPGKLEKSKSISFKSITSLASHFDLKRKTDEGSVPAFPTREEHEELVQSVNLVAKFELKELCVVLNRIPPRQSCHVTPSSHVAIAEIHEDLISLDADEDCYRFLTFNILALETEIKIKTFDRKLRFRLGGIGLEQKYNPENFNLISTPRLTGDRDYLLNIEYIQVERKSPEFYSKYGGALKIVNLEFSQLALVFHQECIAAQIDFFENIKERLDKIFGIEDEDDEEPQDIFVATTKSTDMAKAVSIQEKPENATGSYKKLKVPVRRTRRKKVIDVVDLLLKINLNEITIELVLNNKGLAHAALQGVALKMISKKSYTDVDVTLKALRIYDLNPDCFYKEILCPVEDETIKVKVIMYSNEYAVVQDQCDMSIKAYMACNKFVFLQRFLDSVLGFIRLFQTAEDNIRERAAAAAKKTKHEMKNAYVKATRISLDIGMKAPLVIIPVHSQSPDALIIDLGSLVIRNSFHLLDKKKGDTPIIEDLKLDLQKMCILRASFGSNSSVIKGQYTIIEPVTFQLSIKRNLSNSWYKSIPDIEVSGRFASVNASLSHEDYVMVRSITLNNLQEGIKVPERSRTGKTDMGSRASSISNLAVLKSEMLSLSTEDKQDKEPITVSVKFGFTLDNFIVNLYSGGMKTIKEGVNSRAEEEDLASFVLDVFSVKGKMLSDSSMTVSVVFANFLLKDTRPDNKGILTTLMERKRISEDTEEFERSETSRRSMIDISFKQQKNDTFIDVKVFSFNLILSVAYLHELLEFLNMPPDAVVVTIKRPAAHATASKLTTTASSIQPMKKKEEVDIMTFNIQVEKPDIIVVVNGEDLNSPCLVLNSEITIKYRNIGPRQVISGLMKDIQLYSCIFNPDFRDTSKKQVLKPVSISLAGSTPDGEGLHIDLAFTDFHLNVSPDTIELLSKCYQVLTYNPKEASVVKPEEDYSHVWDVKEFTESDYWFLAPEEAEEAITDIITVTDTSQEHLNEVCVVTLPKVFITMEAGVGNQTLPMILVSMKYNGMVRNWSHSLNVDSTLQCTVKYYNTRLAVWEPLVEPTEVVPNQGLQPWELQCQISQGSGGADEDIDDIPAKTTINIESKSKLEITVTKTCLEVLNYVAKSFSTAVKAESNNKVDIPPFIIQNDTGSCIKLLLEDSQLQMKKSEKTKGKKNIELESGAEVGLYFTNQAAFMAKDNDQALSSDRRDSSMIGLDELFSEIYLKIEFMEVSSDMFQLPLMRASKRFYPLSLSTTTLNETCGIVCEVQAGESTVVTIRGIVQIKSYFNTPIDVYFMTKRGNEVEHIDVVKPNSVLNLPLKAIYTPTGEIFFGLNGYMLSNKPFVWRDLQKSVSQSQLLQCNPKHKEDKDPFFIRVVGDMEQIYFENSKKHTIYSSTYTISLRPTVEICNALPILIIVTQQGNPSEWYVVPGETLFVPYGEPGQTTITIRIPDYMEKEWSCRADIVHSPAEFQVWEFESFDSMAVTAIHLGVHTLVKNGTHILTLYCPFWMINKTSQMLAYKQSDDNGQIFYHPETYNEPVMYSNRSKFFGKTKACLRVDASDWSDKFSLDVVGSSGSVVCKNDKKGLSYKIGVNIALTDNKLTKLIRLTPFYIFMNKSHVDIEVQEFARPADKWYKIESGQCQPFWPHDSVACKLRLRIVHTTEVSPPFLYSSSNSVLLKLKNKFGGIFADVQTTEGSCYISFSSFHPGLAPVLLMNDTNISLRVWEKGSTQPFVLPPMKCVLRSWDCPSDLSRELYWSIGDSKEMVADLRKDESGEVHLQSGRAIHFVSFLGDFQRILLITNNQNIVLQVKASGELDDIESEINIKIKGIGLSLVNNLTRTEITYVGIISSSVVWEIQKGNRYKAISKNDNLTVENAYKKYKDEKDIGGSPNPKLWLNDKTLIDFAEFKIHIGDNVRPLRRSYEHGLWASYKKTKNSIMLHGKVNRLQIDNQLWDCIFPVILAPVPPPKSVATENAHKPFIELSIWKLLIEHSPIQQYKYCTLLVQEFLIRVDIGFVNAISEYFAEGEEQSGQLVKKNFEEDLKRAREKLCYDVDTLSSEVQRNYFEMLHLSPLKVHLSFSMAGMDVKRLPATLSLLIQSLGVTLTDVNDVIFRLAYFERNFSFLSFQQLQSEVTSHYAGQAIKQLYVLVLGLDVIGNPFGLVVNLSQGVEALFYEPYQGAIQGPGEFAEGLALGVKSLFGHTVSGAAGAVGRITTSLGKGVAALSLDKEYQRRRMEAQHKKPQTVQEGLAQTGKGLVMGFYDGISGVVTKPYTGAKQEGAEGFFKGVGKGMLGLVTKPVAGVVDFASGSLGVVKRAAEMSTEATRIRPPRYIQDDEILRPYKLYEAAGNKIFQELNKGRYATTDVYQFHAQINDKETLLLTNQRLMLLTTNDFLGGYNVDWSCTWSEMAAPAEAELRGISISIDKKANIFSKNREQRLFYVDYKDAKDMCLRKINELFLSEARS